MPAGALRESVTFQRRAPSDDGMGNVTTGAWAAISGCEAVNAEILPLKQGEVVIAEGVQGRVLYQVTIWSTPERQGINVGDRMIDAGSSKTFNVKAPPINPDLRGAYLRILVEAGGADG